MPFLVTPVPVSFRRSVLLTFPHPLPWFRCRYWGTCFLPLTHLCNNSCIHMVSYINSKIYRVRKRCPFMCHLPKQIVFFLLFTLLLSLTACSPSLPSTNGHVLTSSNGQSEAESFLSASHSVSSGEQDRIESSSVSSPEEHTAIDNF